MPLFYAQLHRRYGRTGEPISRREMLKAALAGGTGLLLSSRLDAFGKRAIGRRVVVVGAGFAGLAAAHELATAGYDVTVIEARNRVGGRVITFHDLVPGKHVEGGGELVGANHPTWAAYRDRFSLEFRDIVEEDRDFPIVLGGRRLSSKEAQGLWTAMEAALTTMNADAARVTDPFEPWLTDGAEKWDRRTLADWIESLETSALCKSALDAMMTSDNGVRCAWQSYLGNLAMVKGGGLQGYWTDTERFRCKGGNQLLAMRLAAALGASRIRLRTTVQAVDVANETATVRLADGSRLDADDVVLAVPPPVWNRIAIDPPLPPTLVTQMGSNVKFLIALRSRFWQREGLAPDLLSDGLIQQTWHQTDNQAGAGWSMVAFSGGPSADFCREWPAAERNARYLAELGRVYRGLRRNFVRARFMDWPGDAWSKGSYSFPAPGQVTTIGPTLRAGLGRLHFAGEHTCYAFTGYMEGALRSGVDVAQRIACRDGLLKNVA